jgi:nitrogen fixation/metabolism regulation signal transduction histidine kinase
LAHILESAMLVSFALAWPANIAKSWQTRTRKGKSFLFLAIVFLGYIFGIAAKLVSENINYVLAFYILDTVLVLIDMLIYFRNMRLDKKRSMQEGG